MAVDQQQEQASADKEAEEMDVSIVETDGPGPSSRPVDNLEPKETISSEGANPSGDANPGSSITMGGTTLPWVEKHRPRDLKDVVGNEDTVDMLYHFAQKGNMPNVLLCGTPGIGKTTAVLCYARTLLGPSYKEAVLELNASNDRGIDVVRNKIKNFAQKKVTLKENQHKLIILDEADSMTDGAQQALRRTMELYSNTTRFALACNTSDKIIEPIQSRCAILRFASLTDAQVLARLLHICQAETVNYTDDGLEAVVFTAQGDMRQAINNLQSTVAGFGIVTSDNVFKVCDEPHPLMIKEMLTSCSKGDINQAYKVLNHLWKLGYSCEDLVTSIFRVCKTHPMDEYIRLTFIKHIGYTHMKVCNGVNTLLQLTGLVSKMCQSALDHIEAK